MSGIQLYVVRHARAEPRGPRWPDDRKRPLTEDGMASFEALLRSARLRRLRLDLVLTSGLLRAAHTARLLRRALDAPPLLRTSRTLEPGRAPEAVLRTLRRCGVPRVAVVGHEPHLSAVLTVLTGRVPRRPMRKGAVCLVRMARLEAGQGRIAWTADPPRDRRPR